MAKAWPPKDPNEVLDYSIDWTDRLVSETISTSVWSLASGGTDSALVIGSNSINSLRTVVWLSAGTLGGTYYVLNRITTSGNRTMDQTVRIKIKAK